jgi:hypothetical protein
MAIEYFTQRYTISVFVIAEHNYAAIGVRIAHTNPMVPWVQPQN